MAMGRKEFNSGQEARAYVERYAQRVKEITAKIDAFNASLGAIKQKAAVKVPDGFSDSSVQGFESARKHVLATVGNCEKYVANAKLDLADTAKYFKV